MVWNENQPGYNIFLPGTSAASSVQAGTKPAISPFVYIRATRMVLAVLLLLSLSKQPHGTL